MGKRIELKDLRLQKGLTLEEVGKYVGVSKTTVQRWENGGIKNMRRDKIAKLAEILNVSIDELIGVGRENEKDIFRTLEPARRELMQKVLDASEDELDQIGKIFDLLKGN